MTRTARVGMVINPIAGLGGRVGLKGSDGPDIMQEALARGASPAAHARAAIALRALTGTSVEILTAAGKMGTDVTRESGLACRVVYQAGAMTRGADTRNAVSAMVAASVDLLLFAGGDGTAHDVASVCGDVPILGIPAGVKMYSGVFAQTPAAAGAAAATFLAEAPGARRTAVAEVVDAETSDLCAGRSRIALLATAVIPLVAGLQRPKAPSTNADADLDALCRAVAAQIDRNRISIFGPGTTTQKVMAALGLEGTLLGVDAVVDNRIVAKDTSETELLALLRDRPGTIIMGVLGGQGALFGRGNQPISAAVIQTVGKEQITVLASAAKLAALEEPRLFVDTGDLDLDQWLAGYWRVRTAPRKTMIMRI